MAPTATISELTPQAIKRDGKGVTSSRVFDVAFSSGATIADIYALLGASGGLPNQGDPHNLLSGMLCSNIEAVPEGGMDWMVTADYTFCNDPAGNPAPADLSTKTPIVRTSFAPYEVPVQMLNSAKEAFDPPPVDSQFNLIIDIEKYYSKAGMTPTIAESFVNSTNSGSVTVAGKTIAQGFGLIRSIDLDQNTGSNATVYTKAKIQIEVSKAESGWTKLVRDQGLNYLSGADLKPCVDKDGNPVTDPVRLDGSGLQLASNTAESGTVYLAKQVKPLVAWTALALPTDW